MQRISYSYYRGTLSVFLITFHVTHGYFFIKISLRYLIFIMSLPKWLKVLKIHQNLLIWKYPIVQTTWLPSVCNIESFLMHLIEELHRKMFWVKCKLWYILFFILILFTSIIASFSGKTAPAVIHRGQEIFCFNNIATLQDGVKDILEKENRRIWRKAQFASLAFYSFGSSNSIITIFNINLIKWY